MRKYTRKSGYSVDHNLQEKLLKAALIPDERAITIWEKWQLNVDEDNLDEGSHRLLPLLYENLSRLGIEAERLTKYKQVYRFYWYKNQQISRKIFPVLRLFDDEKIDYQLLKGVPLAYQYYTNPGLRPFGDIDILVRPNEVKRLLSELRSMGFSPIVDYPEAVMQEIRHAIDLIDKAGLKIDLHWDILARNWGSREEDTYWSGSNEFNIGTKTVKMISPSALFFQACLHGVEWSNVAPHRWVADCLAINNKSNEKVDWPWIIKEARRRRLSVQLSFQLTYLNTNFGLMIPDEVFSDLKNIQPPRWQKSELKAANQPTNMLRKFLLLWYSHMRLNPNTTLKARIISFPQYLNSIIIIDPEENLILELYRKLWQWI